MDLSPPPSLRPNHPLLPAEYPELQRIKRELSLLSKLYTLYNAVIDSVAGYHDILWADLNIEKINTELQDFQNRFGTETSLMLSNMQVKHKAASSFVFSGSESFPRR